MTTMYDYDAYQDQDTDELAYGNCANCYQLEELGPGNICLVCEEQEHQGFEVVKDYSGD